MAETETKNALEFALLAAGGAVEMGALKRMLGAETGAKQIREAAEQLREEWRGRSMDIVETAGGFQFVSRPEYAQFLRALAPVKPPRLSRPLMEVLAIIAYRQPATRGDIEKIRGVAVSSSQLAFLEECGWVEEVGRRQTPGRPVLYSTTKTFLDDLGLLSLDDLPVPPEPEAPPEAESENDNNNETGGDAEDDNDGDDDDESNNER